MVMTEVFDKLKSLQDILVKRYELEEKIEDAPKQLSSQDELLTRLKKEYIERNAKYEEIRSKVLALRADLETAEKQREAGEAGMDNITTHREYEALDKQITEATAKEQEIRKELAVQEKELSVLQENLKADEEMINSSENALNSSKAALDSELESIKNELSDLKKQEEELTPGIDQEIVYKFQRIIQRNKKGIVAVKKGVCEGCHMILPAQFANERTVKIILAGKKSSVALFRAGECYQVKITVTLQKIFDHFFVFRPVDTAGAVYHYTALFKVFRHIQNDLFL